MDIKKEICLRNEFIAMNEGLISLAGPRVDAGRKHERKGRKRDKTEKIHLKGT